MKHPAHLLIFTVFLSLTLSGVCCINMDDKVPDDRIDVIFEAVQNYE